MLEIKYERGKLIHPLDDDNLRKPNLSFPPIKAMFCLYPLEGVMFFHLKDMELSQQDLNAQ